MTYDTHYRDQPEPLVLTGRQSPVLAPQAHDDRYEADGQQYDSADDQSYASDEYYDEAPYRRRRSGSIVVIAVLGLAVLGTAGAFGYRAMFGDSVLPTLPPIIKAGDGPNKIVPANDDSQASSSNQAGGTGGSGEKLVSREEQLVDIQEPAKTPTTRVVSTIPVWPAQNSAAPGSMPPGAPTLGTPAVGAPAPVPTPPPVRTRTALARPTTPSTATGSVVSPSAGGGYAVQVTSQRSEAEAESAFHALQAKYPNQLGGREPIVRRADLGAKDTYYRALVGPFASIEQAAGVCNSLKAAGGNCIVQRN